MFIPVRQAGVVPTIPQPGVRYHTFLGLVWAGAILSLISVIIRLYARFQGPRRLYLDDYFVIFAEILVLITAGLWQWAAKFMYYVIEAQTGLAIPGPRLLPDLRHWLDVQITAEVFFYTSLLLVKLSFLFFFKRLGQNVHGQKYVWWPVLAFSLIVYVVSMGNIQYKCYINDVQFIAKYCVTEEANNFTMATLRANMAIDVFSDFLIMAIPIIILWSVRIPMKKKIVFVGLFSLSIITMVVAIIRAVTVNSSRGGSGQDDATFLWLWSTIQASLAVIIACLSAFPQLFSASTTNSKPAWTPTDTYYQRLKARSKNSSNSNNTPYRLSSISQPNISKTAYPLADDSSVAPVSGQGNDAASYNSQHSLLEPGATQQKLTSASNGESVRIKNAMVPRSN